MRVCRWTGNPVPDRQDWRQIAPHPLISSTSESSLLLLPPSNTQLRPPSTMSRSRSSSPDPLRQFFSHSRSSSISSSSSPTAKDDLLAAITLESPCEVVEVLPAQIATVLHQETLIEMPGLKGGLKLSVDASPGCGGVVWPAGEVRTLQSRRGMRRAEC